MDDNVPPSGTIESSTQTKSAADADASQLPPHLVPLPGERWGLWRWACLRGAGFPAAEVLRLAAPGSARAADRMLAAMETLEDRRQAALAHLREGLERVDKEERFRCTRAISRLNKGKPPKAKDAAGPVIDAFLTAQRELAVARSDFEEAFAADQVKIGEELRAVAADDRFRQAVAWQNRRALETGLDSLIRTPADGPRNSRIRQHEQLVCSYLQRYSTKNDTIGWFGPIAWARLQTEGPAMVLEPGADLVDQRYVHFENWCVDAIAAALLDEERVRPWLFPRVMPFFLLQGDRYIPVQGSPIRLDREGLALLAACDGLRTALRLADDLVADAANSFASREAVFERLTEFAERKIIFWRVELPMVRRPELALRQLVEGIDDEAIRQSVLSQLEVLESHRKAIMAADDAGELTRALEAFDLWFHDLTGRRATRLGGETYAARTLIHEDCRRDLHLEFGPRILELLGPSLSLVLMSARWLTYRVAERWTQRLTEAYRRLREETGQAAIPLFRFFQHLRPSLLGGEASLVWGVAEEMQQAWLEILEVSEEKRRVTWDSDRLRARVEEAFAAPGPGWKHARQQSPDIQLAAADSEAIRRGDVQFVMGEIHVATNTLRTRLFSESHPDPSVLLDAMLQDIPEPTVAPWLPRLETKDPEIPNVLDLRAINSRLDLGLLDPKDLRLAVNLEPPADTRSETMLVGEFVVRECDGELRIQSLDRRHDFEIMDFLDLAFSVQTVNRYLILPRQLSHVPRVTIDRLVVQREIWRVPIGEIEFAFADSEADRFPGARRWSQAAGMPRFVFCRSPFERKPLFVDFESPTAVEILAHIVRRASELDEGGMRIGISEMLPGLDECWLTDAEGQRFTSELRVVAVDLAPGGANAGRTDPPYAEQR